MRMKEGFTSIKTIAICDVHNSSYNTSRIPFRTGPGKVAVLSPTPLAAGPVLSVDVYILSLRICTIFEMSLSTLLSDSREQLAGTNFIFPFCIPTLHNPQSLFCRTTSTGTVPVYSHVAFEKGKVNHFHNLCST